MKTPQTSPQEEEGGLVKVPIDRELLAARLMILIKGFKKGYPNSQSAQSPAYQLLTGIVGLGERSDPSDILGAWHQKMQAYRIATLFTQSMSSSEGGEDTSGEDAIKRRSEVRPGIVAFREQVVFPGLLPDANLLELLVGDLSLVPFSHTLRILGDTHRWAQEKLVRIGEELETLTKQGIMTGLNQIPTISGLIQLLYSDDFDVLLESQVRGTGLEGLLDLSYLASLIRSMVARDILGMAGFSRDPRRPLKVLSNDALRVLQLTRAGRVSLRDWNAAFQVWYEKRHAGKTPPRSLFEEGTTLISRPLVVGAEFVPPVDSPGYREFIEFVREAYGKADIPLGLTFEVGTPYERRARELSRELYRTFPSQIFLYPRRRGQGIEPEKFSPILFGQNYFAVLPHRVPVRIPHNDQDLVNRAFYAEEWFARDETVGLAAGFIEMSLMVLSSPYLKELLEKPGDVPLPVMTENVFNSLVDFFNEIAQTEIMRQAVARAA